MDTYRKNQWRLLQGITQEILHEHTALGVEAHCIAADTASALARNDGAGLYDNLQGLIYHHIVEGIIPRIRASSDFIKAIEKAFTEFEHLMRILSGIYSDLDKEFTSPKSLMSVYHRGVTMFHCHITQLYLANTDTVLEEDKTKYLSLLHGQLINKH